MEEPIEVRYLKAQGGIWQYETNKETSIGAAITDGAKLTMKAGKGELDRRRPVEMRWGSLLRAWTAAVSR